MPSWTDGDGGCDCPSGHSAGLGPGRHREGEPGCCFGQQLRKKKVRVASKKKKKAEAPVEWIVKWAEVHIEQLKKLGHGWATIHPEHGVIMHDTMGLIHLFGKNRFIKRSIIKECVHIDVASTVRSHSKYEPLTVKEIEEAREDMKKERIDGLPDLARSIDVFDNEIVLDTAPSPSQYQEPTVTLADFAKTHALKATDVLMTLIAMGMTGVSIHTVLDADTLTKLEEHCCFTPSLPHEAKSSPHKQPPFKQYNSRGFDRGIVLDRYTRYINKTRVD